jgi:hypothetical protein
VTTEDGTEVTLPIDESGDVTALPASLGSVDILNPDGTWTTVSTSSDGGRRLKTFDNECLRLGFGLWLNSNLYCTGDDCGKCCARILPL